VKVYRKPEWLKIRLSSEGGFGDVKGTLREYGLHTVCEEARCPNLHECWSHGTATVMILGDVCTRGCRFCAVKTGNPGGKVDPLEPVRVAAAVKRLNLRYVVLTMVDRDDLPDGGAFHVAETVRRKVVESPLDVFAHNVETVRRLTPYVRDRRASYDLSLRVLKYAKEVRPDVLTKSSIMVGMGETEDEVVETMRDPATIHLRSTCVLRPSPGTGR